MSEAVVKTVSCPKCNDITVSLDFEVALIDPYLFAVHTQVYHCVTCCSHYFTIRTLKSV